MAKAPNTDGARDYSPEEQELFLTLMLTSADFYTRVSSIFNSDNFDDGPLRAGAKFIEEYALKYSKIPEITLYNATIKDANIVKDVIEDAGPYTEWFLDNFEKFTRYRELIRAIENSVDLLGKGDSESIEGIIKKATQISLQRDMGINYFSDPAARLTAYFEQGGQVSTGYPSLDKVMFGGLSRGELFIAAGSSGAGKSLFMMNLGLNLVQQGLHGLYITLELAENLTALRTDAMLTGTSTKDIRSNIDDTALKVAMSAKRGGIGSYQIKYFPAQSTVNQLRGYIREYEISVGRKVDFLIIDYLDLVMPSGVKLAAGDISQKDKYTTEQLRNLMQELGVIGVTASQLNRCLSLDTKIIRNGQEIEIKDVNVGDWIESSDGPVQVYEKLPVTTQPVYKIKTKSGKEIICSANHKFPVGEELKTINSGLVVGDSLRVIDADGLSEISSIEYLGEQETVDINTTDNRLFYANGILTHNSAVGSSTFDHSHVAGGLTKINTADWVFAISSNISAMNGDEGDGKYNIQCLKSRNSTGVGRWVELLYNPETMRMTDPEISGNDGARVTKTLGSSSSSSSPPPISTPSKPNGETQNDPPTGNGGRSKSLEDMLSKLKKSTAGK